MDFTSWKALLYFGYKKDELPAITNEKSLSIDENHIHV